MKKEARELAMCGESVVAIWNSGRKDPKLGALPDVLEEWG